MITMGIDCGTRNTKAIVFKDGEIIGRMSVLTGFEPEKAAREAMESALELIGVRKSDIDKIGATGTIFDPNELSHISVDHVTAIAKAVYYFFPSARTVVDIGAEEGRVVKLDDGGNMVDFAINERCAAGAGAFIESMARALEVDIEEMGPMAMKSTSKIPMNAQCVIFAESEVISLIHSNVNKEDISKAIHDAMASRIVSMIRRVGLDKDFVMMGGVAKNPGLVNAIKKELNLQEVFVPDAPEYGAAAGAALAAAQES